ncbi:MAG: hypothetical protein ACREHG_00860 [Candidatus Saccharimonadales bacterium]
MFGQIIQKGAFKNRGLISNPIAPIIEIRMKRDDAIGHYQIRYAFGIHLLVGNLQKLWKEVISDLTEE